MKFTAPDPIRAAEAEAIAKVPGLGLTMMKKAGRGVARMVAFMAESAGGAHSVIRLLAGPGNNGGDACVAAVDLQEMGFLVEVWLACPSDRIRGDARICFDQMMQADVPCRILDTEEKWAAAVADSLPALILVDALLGTGASGPLKGTIRCACDYLGTHRERSLVVAVDLPTGMDGETGILQDGGVQADVTVTMGVPKAGMAAPEALQALGSLYRVDIDLPEDVADSLQNARPGLQWISGMESRRALPMRPRRSHKGTYGRALIMGGSWQYPGAIVLAAEGAARSGVGLVRVATVERALPAVVSRVPEAIAAADLDAEFPLDGMTGILLGPGLGRTPEARRLVARLLRETPCPLVLDADGIAVLEGKPEAVQTCAQPVILTPHPGELALLTGRSVQEIQSDRLAAAREAAARTGAIVVLKGAGTLVAKDGEDTRINLNGNPGMACGGSGDVLAGLLAGLLAQGMDPLVAAQTAVWIHGAAGDAAAWRLTEPAMKAGDIAEELPAAFRRLLYA